jgi:hypothetical protein
MKLLFKKNSGLGYGCNLIFFRNLLIIIVVEKMHSLVLANGRFQDQA